MNGRRIAVVVSVAVALGTIAFCADVARAEGDATGSLAAGGTAHGDISSRAGEHDGITVDAGQGATLRVSLRASFAARLEVTDPDGAPAGVASGRRIDLALAVATAGTYTLAVQSADGSQGTYTLAAKPQWPRTIQIAGAGQHAIDVGLPAGAKLSCIVTGARGAAAPPRIVGLDGPDGAPLLAGVIEPRGSIARLGPTVAPTAGIYRLTIAPSDGASAWSGRVVRTLPRLRPVALRLTNGLTPISFRAGGVGAVFAQHCAGCHGWATSLDGVRAYASGALSRMASGSMPPSGGVSAREIALVRTWIATGMRP